MLPIVLNKFPKYRNQNVTPSCFSSSLGFSVPDYEMKENRATSRFFKENIEKRVNFKITFLNGMIKSTNNEKYTEKFDC